MKFNPTLRRLIALGATVRSTIAAIAADLVLNDRRTSKSARLVMIGDADVDLVYGGEAENIDLGLESLDDLARAHTALQEDATVNAGNAVEIKRKAAAVSPSGKVRCERIEVYLIMSEVSFTSFQDNLQCFGSMRFICNFIYMRITIKFYEYIRDKRARLIS